MRDKTQRELKSILSQHRRRSSSEQRQIRREQAAPQEFQKAWNRTVTGLLRPLLTEIKQQLTEAGHRVEVDVAFDADAGRARQYRDVTFSLIPGTYRGPDPTERTTPHIAFQVDVPNSKINLHYCSVLGSLGGSEGPNGEFDLTEITAAFVEDKVVAFVRDILGR